MIHRQANAMILLALANACLPGLVLECRAADGQLNGDVEQAKWREWIGEFRRQLDERTAAEKKTPEQIVETLKRLQATMPQDYDESDDELQKKRTELSNLIDMGSVDEECLVRDVFRRFKKKYDLSSGYSLPVWPLLRDYAKHFQNKQAEICAAKISRQLAIDVASLREKDKRYLEALMSHLPQSQQTSDNWEWDKKVGYAVTGEDKKQQFYRDIYRFIKTKESFLSAKPDAAWPSARQSVEDAFEKRMAFCARIDGATRDTFKDYIGIRFQAEFDEWASRFTPETLHWIKAIKVCGQIQRIDYGGVKEAVLNEYLKDHQQDYDEFERANKKPSGFARLLGSLKLKTKEFY